MSRTPCLLDTHSLLWAFYAPERLSTAARDAITHADQLFVSIVTLWEIALKLSRGGYGDLVVLEDWNERLVNEMQRQGYQLLSVEVRDCRAVQDLPFHHKDPFDRMLVAQAKNRGLDIISLDEVIGNYGVQRVW